MARIFISYKRVDKDKVFPIVEEIKQKTGVDCWIDLEGIESGDQFQNVIIDAIDNADIVVFMLSKNFIAPYKDEKTRQIDLKKQTFPEKEVMYALNEGKRLIPLSFDGTTVNDCKWLKFNCCGLDCIDWHKKEQRDKLLANLQQWCDKPEDKNSKKNGVTTNITERTLCHNQNFSYNVFKSNIHKCLKDKYATFSGRANRTEFWSFALLEVVIALLAFIIYVSIGTTFIIYLWLIITLGLACPNIAVSVRRLHDIGLNGWWYLASFIPYIGWLWFLVLGCIPSKGKKDYNRI